MEKKNNKKRSYSDKCKCCLTNRHILKDLWGVNFQGDREVYGEMITKCFAISWQKPVDRTELICGPCIKTLLIAFKFKKDVLTSEQILLAQLKDEDNEFDEIVEEVMIDDNIIKEDLIPDEDENRDNKDKLEYFEVVYLEDHQSFGKPVKKEKDVTVNYSVLKHPSPSARCGQKMPSSLGLMQHKCTQPSNTSSWDIEEQREQTANKFTCDICKGNFKLKRSLTRHMMQIHKYGDKSKIVLTCKICNKQFPRSSNLVAHQLVHTSDKPYSCKFCNKQFSQSSHLNMHQRIHTGDKPYSCKICKKQFSFSTNLNTHKRTHTGVRPYSCKICKKQFSQRSNLITHQRIHTGEKPYSCKICNKGFSRSSLLITHQRIHTGDKPFSCNICHKQFSVSSNLIRHQLVHTGNKPYSCKICNKQFSQSSTLTKHQRIHTGDKPYSCKICNKQFSVSSTLITHQRIHTGEMALASSSSSSSAVHNSPLQATGLSPE